MGEHWVNWAEFEAQAQAGLPVGPIYLVHKGEVIGLEYMWSQDIMMQEFTIATPEGATVDHFDINFIPEGHPGVYEVPHQETHLYFITQEEKAAITPED